MNGEKTTICLLVGCLTSQQHASVSQGRICSDNFTCCHTEIEVADPTFYLTQSQYTDTGPTSPSADPITPGAWQGSHWSANFRVTGMTLPRKNPGAERDSNPGSSALEADALTTRPTRRSKKKKKKKKTYLRKHINSGSQAQNLPDLSLWCGRRLQGHCSILPTSLAPGDPVHFCPRRPGCPNLCFTRPPRWPRAEDPGFESRLRRDFSGSSHTSDSKIGTPVATLPGAGRIGSALGLVGPVSVYCDWVR